MSPPKPVTSYQTTLGTDYILNALAEEGLGHLFMVPGGLVDPFMPALARQDKLTPVVAAHEGGAVFMADGYRGRAAASVPRLASAAPAPATWRPQSPPRRPMARRCW